MTEELDRPVIVTRHDGWAEVALARPARKNAITGPLGEALAAALHELDDDESVRAILLCGSGGAFCSGLDLKAFNADPRPEWVARFQDIWRGAHKALYGLEKPLVGALERYAINGGAALAIACDLLVAGKTAYLQVGEAQIGMAAPYNMAWLALRHTEALAARIALVGRRFEGPELLALGVVYEVVEDAAVLARARALTAELAGYPPGGLRSIKRALRAGVDQDADAWFDRFVGAGPRTVAPPAPRS
ncbi:MAG: enoyl-CoA hydratase/isomerase family protein [Pseudomonadales bacterium]|nr:enoyl-CoA hydratase/isomerase family protein [Pseudomonadales bacterium]